MTAGLDVLVEGYADDRMASTVVPGHGAPFAPV
jgi:hypothetical protein